MKYSRQDSSLHAQPRAYRVIVLVESQRAMITEHDSFAAAEISRRLLSTRNEEEIRIESRALDGSYSQVHVDMVGPCECLATSTSCVSVGCVPH